MVLVIFITIMPVRDKFIDPFPRNFCIIILITRNYSLNLWSKLNKHLLSYSHWMKPSTTYAIRIFLSILPLTASVDFFCLHLYQKFPAKQNPHNIIYHTTVHHNHWNTTQIHNSKLFVVFLLPAKSISCYQRHSYHQMNSPECSRIFHFSFSPKILCYCTVIFTACDCET